MIALHISRASAVLLAGAGAALLFAADDLLPRLIPGFPPQGVWLGQLLAAAWLGIAALNWLNRRARLGGIYGRPIVLTNISVYFISAMTLLRISRVRRLRPSSSRPPSCSPSSPARTDGCCFAVDLLSSWTPDLV